MFAIVQKYREGNTHMEWITDQMGTDSTIKAALKYLQNIERDIARCDPEHAELLGEEAAELAKIIQQVSALNKEISYRYNTLRANAKAYQKKRKPMPA